MSYDCVLSEGFHTARKRHRCDDCGKAIEPGTRYYWQTGIYEGDFGTFRAHFKGRFCEPYSARPDLVCPV